MLMLRLAVATCLSCVFAVPVAAQDVYFPSDQVTPPRVVKAAKPLYAAEVMLYRIRESERSIVLQVDVLPDGTVGTVALVRSPLGEGLVEKAVKAVKQSLYTPGMKDGQPVTVRIEVRVALGVQ